MSGNERARESFRPGDMIGPFRLMQEIAFGSFGKIFRAQHVDTRDVIAIKVARKRSFASDQLVNEYVVYKTIARMFPQQHPNAMGCFPVVHWLGNFQEDTFLAMELLGLDLYQILKHTPGHKFSLKTVLMIGDQLITSLNKLHAACYLHCDIKPENIALKTSDTSKRDRDTLCLLDLGLTRQYWNPSTNTHVAYDVYDHMNGTACYASVNIHNFIEPTRRDDLESLVFVLVYLHTGTLPWDHLQDQQSKLHQEMGVMKQRLAELPLFRQIDGVFLEMIHRIRLLRFDETPNYADLRQLQWDCALRKGLLSETEQQETRWAWDFDWLRDSTFLPKLVAQIEAESKDRVAHAMQRQQAHPNDSDIQPVVPRPRKPYRQGV